MPDKLPVPANEEARLQALLDYAVLDTLPEEELDAITRLASFICQTPIALVSLIDGKRQWFKSKVGLSVDETLREYSFCQYAIMGSDIFEVPDALKDDRFKHNPLVTGSPDIRFYAGVPLENPGGLNMGSLCVIDTEPRHLTKEQREALMVLAKQVIFQLELRKKNAQLTRDQQELQRNRQMLQAIATATEELLSTSDYLEAIARCLPLLGKAVGADYNYFYKNRTEGDNQVTSRLLMWEAHNDTIAYNTKELQHLPLTFFGAALKQLEHNQPLSIQLSRLQSPSPLFDLMQAQRTKSALIIPVFIKSSFWGYVGYGERKEERQWDEAEVSLLRGFANSIANAIERAETSREMYNMALFPLENPEPVFRINLEGKLILQSEAAKSITFFEHRGRKYTPSDFFKYVAGQLSRQQKELSLEVGHKGQIFSVMARLSASSDYINIYTSDITRLKHTEKELERLSMVAKANSKGVLFIDLEGKVSWCNEGFADLTQYKPEEILTNAAFALFGGALTATGTLDSLRNTFVKGEAADADIILYRKSRSWFWANIKIQPLLDEQGQLKEFFAMVEDISNKKAGEELLKESESRMSAIIQNINSGILLKDEHRHVILVNRQFNNLFRISDSPIAPGDDFKTISRKLGPHFMAHADVQERLEQVLQDGQVMLGEELELADGRWVERDYIPIIQGDVYKGHLWRYSDVTARKSYERNLKSQEEKYRSIIANMNLGLMELDMDGVVQHANSTFCSNSGFSQQEVVGKRAMQMLGIESSGDEPIPAEALLEVSRLPVLNKRGELRWWLLSGAPNMNDVGEQTGFVIISLDITEQKVLEEELLQARHRAEESAKAKERFFANISHEIRTPLNAIIGMVKELSRERLTQKQKMYVHHANAASQHLLSLVNNILDMSKIGAGELHLENRSFSLREVIADAVNIMAPAAKDKLLAFEVFVAEAVAPAFAGDPNRVRQILINLLSNAIKFTQEGKVVLTCEVAATTSLSQQVNLRISDTGIGMEEAFLKNIFSKFSQEEVTTARRYGGTGLGMSITYELVQLMNGTIQVFSKKGAGTRVELELPLVLADEKGLASLPVAENADMLQGKQVLLVEDNELNLMVASNSLRRFGMEITEAVNGLEAVEKLKMNQFDLVLMDLQMPVMDGIEATRIIREELKLTVPVIAFTANAFKSDVEQQLASGMNGYVIKPFEERELLAVIKDVLLKTVAQATDAKNLNPANLYSLHKLMEISSGDVGFVRKMLEVFATHTSASVQEIKAALQQHDVDTIRKVAHRIKPSLEKLDVQVLQQDIYFLENLSPGTPPIEKLTSVVAHLEEVIALVVAHVESITFD